MTLNAYRPLALASVAAIVAAASPALAGVALIVPDNGTGTATLPPVGGLYHTPDDDMQIIDGLPPGTTIDADATLHSFSWDNDPPTVYSFPDVQNQAGGTLGGRQWASEGVLNFPLLGTGTLDGFSRNIDVPVSFEIHSGPVTPFAAVQSFDTDLFRLFGQITGDPDFDLLRIVAGTDFGLPSPGHTTLTQLPGGNWAVDSFFDITYRIDFVGAPGGPLAGMSGSTTATVRFQAGIPAPSAAALLGVAGLTTLRRRRR